MPLAVLYASAALALAASAGPARAFSPAPVPAVGPAPIGRAGSYNDLVAHIQAALDRNGYKAGPADGMMGPHTRRAIEYFQRTHGLRATGEPSPELLRRIQVAGRAARRERNEERREQRAMHKEPAIHSRVAVRRVQEALDSRGYHAGPPDGEMGSATRRAIRRYRRDARLPITGEITARLLADLGIPEGTAHGNDEHAYHYDHEGEPGHEHSGGG